jgi:hypothetical protein
VSPLEFADKRTWPLQVRQLREQLVIDLEPDMLWTLSAEPFLAALGQHKVRLWHCTRLTEREMTDVRTNGLRPLSPKMVAERIAHAVSDGHLTSEEGSFYAQSRCSHEEGRRGMIHCFADRRGLARTADVIHLLRIWGGEGINQAWHTRSAESARLQKVGVPTVVSVAIDPRWASHSHPGWLSALVTGEGTSVIFRREIPASCIEDMYQPGSDIWDQYVGWNGD